MARVLRRISPRRASAPSTDIPDHAPAATLRNGATIRIDGALPSSGVPPNSAAVEEGLLRVVRECSEIIHSQAPREHTPPQQATQEPDVTSVGKANTLELSPQNVSKAEVRVRLRLSKQLARILNAFRKAGRNPGQIVESSLWNDPRIRDAAAILRLDRES